MAPPSIMTVSIPNVKRTYTGVCSPRSPNEGYSCAFPSWPNRPFLDSRESQLPRGEVRMPLQHSIPDIKFFERLRGQTLPEECIIDDDDDDACEEDDDFFPSTFGTGTTDLTTSSSSFTTSSSSTYIRRARVIDVADHHPLPSVGQQTMKRSNSLLSRAFAQMQLAKVNTCAPSLAVDLTAS